MGLFWDSLRTALGGPAARRAGAVGLAGRLWGCEGVQVTHPELPELEGVELWHFAKAGARRFAVTMTVGLAEQQERELFAITAADSRDPQRDRVARMLGVAATTGDAPVALGATLPLPEGCLGRSAHDWAMIVDPDRPGLEVGPDHVRLLGGLDLVVPLTEEEAAFARIHGAEALCAAMEAQGVALLADRPAGVLDVELAEATASPCSRGAPPAAGA